MIDQLKLDTALQSDAIAGLSDADAATALSAPILTPKKTPITSTTLGAVWGVTAAATLKATLRAMIAGGGANGALADYVLGVLEGAGFDATNAQAVATAQQFVAAKLVTQDQINQAFYDSSYTAGDVVSAADVTAARLRVTRKTAAIALTNKAMALNQAVATFLNENLATALSSGAPIPAWSDLQAAIATAYAGNAIQQVP